MPPAPPVDELAVASPQTPEEVPLPAEPEGLAPGAPEGTPDGAELVAVAPSPEPELAGAPEAPAAIAGGEALTAVPLPSPSPPPVRPPTTPERGDLPEFAARTPMRPTAPGPFSGPVGVPRPVLGAPHPPLVIRALPMGRGGLPVAAPQVLQYGDGASAARVMTELRRAGARHVVVERGAVLPAAASRPLPPPSVVPRPPAGALSVLADLAS